MEPIKVTYLTPFLPTPLKGLGYWGSLVAHAMDQYFLHKGVIEPINYWNLLNMGTAAGQRKSMLINGIFQLRDRGYITLTHDLQDPMNFDADIIIPANWQPERFRSPVQD